MQFKADILDELAAGLNDVETQILADNIYQVRENMGCNLFQGT